MTLPLYQPDASRPRRREADGHAGLWYDKFCSEWRIEGSMWTLKDRKGAWIETLTRGAVGCTAQIQESALRLAAVVDAGGGRWDVYTTDSAFVTGLGRSHPVENGFAWHPTLGTPYLPGSSVKGLVRAWAKLDADPTPDCDTLTRLLGGPGRAGTISFLDAVPTTPVQLQTDVMTPHYAGWSKDQPPGDWRSPVPIPFLVTAPETPFLLGLIPCRDVSSESNDLAAATDWLRSALTWAGAGAKTAVGYGRFRHDTGKTEDLRDRLGDRDRGRDQRIRTAREAEERAIQLAALSPVERQIEETLDNRQDRSTPAVLVIIQAVRSGRWGGDAKVEVAAWLKGRMQRERHWKEQSGAKNPAKDRPFQRTLLIKRWLDGE